MLPLRVEILPKAADLKVADAVTTAGRVVSAWRPVAP